MNQNIIISSLFISFILFFLQMKHMSAFSAKFSEALTHWFIIQSHLLVIICLQMWPLFTNKAPFFSKRIRIKCNCKDGNRGISHKGFFAELKISNLLLLNFQLCVCVFFVFLCVFLLHFFLNRERESQNGQHWGTIFSPYPHAHMLSQTHREAHRWVNILVTHSVTMVRKNNDPALMSVTTSWYKTKTHSSFFLLPLP